MNRYIAVMCVPYTDSRAHKYLNWIYQTTTLGWVPDDGPYNPMDVDLDDARMSYLDCVEAIDAAKELISKGPHEHTYTHQILEIE